MADFLFITAGDIHISDHNPRSRKDNFRETILGKIEQMRVACSKLSADGMLLVGDLFNLKNPVRNSHSLVRELIQLFGKFKCPVYMIPGNHDLSGNNLYSLPNQPLGVIFASGAVKNLTHKTISKKGVKISLVGIPFTEKLDLESLKIPSKEDCAAQICLMHIYAGPQPGNLFRERLYGYEELAALSPDIFVIGHYHVDQGISKVKDKYFVNLGSISRGALSDENINHEPKLGFIKISVEKEKLDIDINAAPLKIKPPEEIFDLVKREEEKKEETEIQKFVENLVLNSSAVEDQDKNIENILGKMDLEKSVVTRVLHFIQEASAVRK